MIPRWTPLPLVRIGAIATLVLAAGCNRGPRTSLPACPAGATLMGAPPPKGSELWCQKIVNGKAIKNGRFILFDEGGNKLIEGDYRDGVQEGEWTTWYPNGQRSAIDHYRDGLQDGTHISWYANGQKAIEGGYRAGKREGVWTRWDPSGFTSKRRIYRDDRVVG